MFKNLLCEKKESTYVITLNRPKHLNSLNRETLEELNQAIDIFSKDKESCVAVITGEGKAFVAGADIPSMKEMDVEEAREFSKFGIDIFRKIESMDKVVIAAINGFALGGGCELALSCDIRIASNKAKFSQPEINLGIIPGFSGTQRLSRIVGLSKAKELIYTGDMIDANEALNIKLVNKVVEPEELLDEAMKMADKISKKAPLALKYAKHSINKGYETDIDNAINIENYLFAMCFASKDQKEGMSAFLEKREANFIGE